MPRLLDALIDGLHEALQDALPALVAEHWPRALATALLVCALLPMLPALWSSGRGGALAAQASAESAEWPRSLDGATLRPLAMTALEQRFAARFPGRIGRFASAEASWVLREVNEPTRLLHPAADCYRGLGYRIEHTALEADRDARLWRCFVATRDGHAVRVCERIVDARGQGYTDTSAWYWAATLGQSSGPWRAVTRVEAL